MSGFLQLRRSFVRLGIAFGTLGATASGWYHLGLLVNHTGSLPIGLYRVERLSDAERAAAAGGRLAPPRGAVVVWCLPADVAALGRRRGYLVRGSCPGGAEPVLKHIAAVAGDTVVVGANGLRVDGHLLANSGVLSRDARGRPMIPITPGIYPVRFGTAWLWSPYTVHSFDSRYFGAVPLDGWVGVAHPVWVRWWVAR